MPAPACLQVPLSVWVMSRPHMLKVRRWAAPIGKPISSWTHTAAPRGKRVWFQNPLMSMGVLWACEDRQGWPQMPSSCLQSCLHASCLPAPWWALSDVEDRLRTMCIQAPHRHQLPPVQLTCLCPPLSVELLEPTCPDPTAAMTMRPLHA